MLYDRSDDDASFSTIKSGESNRAISLDNYRNRGNKANIGKAIN